MNPQEITHITVNGIKHEVTSVRLEDTKTIWCVKGMEISAESDKNNNIIFFVAKSSNFFRKFRISQNNLKMHIEANLTNDLFSKVALA